MKKFLSLFLVFATLASLCAVPVFGLEGSEHGGGGVIRDVAWHGHVPADSRAGTSGGGLKSGFYTDYFEREKGKYCIRMRAFPLTEDANQQYFVQSTNGEGVKVIDQVAPDMLVNATGYNTAKGWIYFCDGANYNPNGAWAQDKRDCFPLLQFFDYGLAEQTYIWRPASEPYKKFVSLCGEPYSNQVLTNAATLSRLLNSEYLKSKENMKELGEFLGADSSWSDHYFIVIEQVLYDQQYFHGHRTYADDGGTGWGHKKVPFELGSSHTYWGHEEFADWDWFVAESRATYEAKDEGNGHYLVDIAFGNAAIHNDMKFVNVGGDCKGFYARTVRNINWWQDNPPFKNSVMGHKENGYSLHSFGDPQPVNAGANIAVEYQGDVNTSNPMEFVSTGSLINTHNGSISYWDFSNKKWVATDDHADLLKFTGKIDMSSEYALCFTSAAEYTMSGDSKLIPELAPAFETKPGEGFNSSSLQWGSEVVSSQPFNVGWVWKVLTLDGTANTASIQKKFEDAWKAVYSGTSNSYVICSGTADTTESFKTESVEEGSWSNFNLARSYSADGVLSEDELTHELKFVNDKQLGVGFEFIIRGTPITSRKVTFTVTAEEDGAVQSIDSNVTWSEDYTTAKETICGIDGDSIYWLVVPGLEDDVRASISSSLNGVTDATVDNVRSAFRSGAYGVVLENGNPTAIGLGATDEHPPRGYTVYEVKVKFVGNVPPQPRGEVTLPAYMLNRYFDNIIQTSSALKNGSPSKYTVRREWTWIGWHSPVGLCCGFSGIPSYYDNWVIDYQDSAASSEFGYDSDAMIDRYYPVATGTWTHAQRSQLVGNWPVTVDTRSLSGNPVVDYGFNLIRARVKDYRAVSGISYQSYQNETHDAQNLLKMESYFGVVPSSAIVNADRKRNSEGIVENGTFTERFSIESRFNYYSDKEGWQCPTSPPHYHSPCYHTHGSGDSAWSHYCSGLRYYIDSDKYRYTCLGFMGPYGAVNTISYSFDNTVFKYQSKAMPAGWNSLISGTDGTNTRLHAAVDTSLSSKAQTGNVVSTTAYRFANARYNDIDLLYYPEVLMVYKIGQTQMSEILAQPYVSSFTIGELKRTAKSSGLYLFKIDTVTDGATITGFEGTVYSDSMLGGSSALGFGSTVSIPAGADVTVATDPKDIQINLYGYELDVVQTSDDGHIGATNKAFKDVVADGEDVYSKWGNSSRAQLDSAFSTWCDKMLNVNNYAADFKLYVDGGLKSENFSATIGKIDTSAATIKQEGVYQIVIEKGVLQTSKGDYNALITQLAKDYFSDATQTAKARQLFEKSGLYQTIINAMETCKNTVNKSGTANAVANWTDTLGGDGNWYDECSRTFVIRRYAKVGSKICDIIATDKIDYQLAPSGTTQYNENLNSGVGYDAKWKVSIFFNWRFADDINNLLLDWVGNGKYYQPHNGTTSGELQSANNEFTVLVDSLDVLNADFKIPASSTQDFYN